MDWHFISAVVTVSGTTIDLLASGTDRRAARAAADLDGVQTAALDSSTARSAEHTLLAAAVNRGTEIRAAVQDRLAAAAPPPLATSALVAIPDAICMPPAAIVALALAP